MDETKALLSRLAAVEKLATAADNRGKKALLLLERTRAQIASLHERNRKFAVARRQHDDAIIRVLETLTRLTIAQTEAGSPQERLWRDNYGVRYITRSLSENWEETRVPFWEEVARRIGEPGSVTELGCNIGFNLAALRKLWPDTTLSAIEINPIAAEIARALTHANVSTGTLFDAQTDAANLCFTRGVLIHVAPERLNEAFDRLAELGRVHIFLAEHHAEMPTSDAEYPPKGFGVDDGHSYLFRRDFGAAFRDRHPEFSVVEEWAWPLRGDFNDYATIRCTLMQRQDSRLGDSS